MNRETQIRPDHFKVIWLDLEIILYIPLLLEGLAVIRGIESALQCVAVKDSKLLKEYHACR